MWEQIKTLLLIFLVISSVFLTGKLWLSDHNDYEWTDEVKMKDINYGEAPSPIEQVKPLKIIYYSEQTPKEAATANEYASLWYEGQESYTESWDFINHILAEKWSGEQVYLQKKESLTITSPLLEYHFKDFPIETIIQDENFSYTARDLGQNIKLVLELADTPQLYLVDEDTSYELQWDARSNISREKISDFNSYLTDKSQHNSSVIDEASLADIFTEVSHEVVSEMEKIQSDNSEDNSDKIENEFLSDMSHSIEELSSQIEADNEIIDMVPDRVYDLAPQEIDFEKKDQEDLARAFFLDLSFVRKIQERDGTNIYTDGQRALRFYPIGGLEYNNPQREEDTPRSNDIYTLLSRSGRQIALYGGWNENLRISITDTNLLSHRPGRESHQIKYRYYHEGIPIINDYPLKLQLTSSGLIEYYRRIPEVQESLAQDSQFVDFDTAVRNWLSDELGRPTDRLSEMERESWIDNLDMLGEQLQNVESIHVAYQLNSQANYHYLLPVWKIVIEDEQNVTLPMREISYDGGEHTWIGPGQKMYC